MKRFIYRLGPFWLCFVFWFPGSGIVNANDSMTFYQASAGNSYEATWIAAEGTITEDTPKKFRDYLKKNGAEGGKVIFNSPGGNLLAGLQLGRILRDQGLAVSVGKTVRDPDGFRETLSAGVCASACAYAFLGGVDRYLYPNGWKLEDNKIGFHQFYTDSSITNALTAAEATVVKNATLSQAQFITGMIAAYIVEMGADATLLEVASKGGPDQMIYPDPNSLEELGIINPKGFGSWFMEPYKQGLVVASKKRRRSTPYDLVEQVTIFCRSKSKAPIVLLTSQKADAFPTTSSGPTKLSAYGARIQVGNASNDVPNTSIEVKQPKDSTLFFVDVGTHVIEEISRSSEFSISLEAPRASGGFHATCSFDDMERAMIKLALKNCI